MSPIPLQADRSSAFAKAEFTQINAIPQQHNKAHMCYDLGIAREQFRTYASTSV
jgi:hypothetical protein